MPSDANPGFEKFWAEHGELLLNNIAIGDGKQACYASFVAGEVAQLEPATKNAGREALDGSAAHASPGQPAPRVCPDTGLPF